MMAGFLPAADAHQPVGLVEPVIGELREGHPIVIVDRTANADAGAAVVLVAGALATTYWTSWVISHTSGLLFAPLLPSRADTLDLPPMVAVHARSTLGSTVAVDAAAGISTGISAADRSRTVRVLADPDSTPASLTRPGHIIPVRVDPRGVLGRAEFAEAGVDLCVLAGLAPVAVLSDLMNDDGSVCTAAQARGFAERQGVACLDIDDLLEHLLVRSSEHRSRLSCGGSTYRWVAGEEYIARSYRDDVSGAEHVAFTGSTRGPRPAFFVHGQCVDHDIFDRIACGCDAAFVRSLATISRDGGTVIYLQRGATTERTRRPFLSSAFNTIRDDLDLHDVLPSTATATSWVWSGPESHQ